MPCPSPDQSAAWLRERAAAFMQSLENDLHFPDRHEPAFGMPLLGFASGADPIWESFKEHVGPEHWTPAEAFALGYPEEAFRPEELSVAVWILPQTDATLRDQRGEKTFPAERWARSRIFGESAVNDGLRKRLLSALRERGIQAVSPMLLPEWSRVPSDRFVFSSTWSERHAAYAAGLGTFSLCDGLITPVGKAMRVGSLVARLDLPVSTRAYRDHREYCLLFNSGTCGLCIQRCPAQALSKNGHDKRKCAAYLDTTRPFVRDRFGFDGYGCGFCQVGVPCERGIPHRPERRPG